jgi:endonuclease III
VKPALDPDLIFKKLKKQYPDAHCALIFSNPFELLVATILSAQCTDVRVNLVTPKLFELYPTCEKMARAELLEIETLVRSTGFYHNKAKNLIGCARQLVEKHQGVVPQDLESLAALPGVGRKTANVVLGNAFNIASGVVVDTHVGRLSYRMGWTKSENAVIIERDLSKKFDRKKWILLPHLLISHGRGPCRARSPLCQSCFLFDPCPRTGVK